MRHLTIENVMAYVEGRTSGMEKTGIEGHLSSCDECAGLQREFQNLVSTLEQDATFEPPAEALKFGLELFQPAAGGKVRRIMAALVFDSFEQPAMAGVRRVGAPPRQLLFRAGDVDVDVRIEAMEANDRITLVGQVLLNGAKFFDNTPVKLESHGMVRFATKTNVVGEFSFDEVPKETYHLSVDLPEGQITLFCVHRANA